MTLPIGYDNFRDIIEQQLTFVDKSLLIKDFIDDRGTQVSVVTRPRRFGKSVNLSMLHHYFAKEVHGKPTQHLFTGLKITEQDSRYLQYQGKYPVIALSFKDIKDGDFASVYASLNRMLSRIYSDFTFLLDSPKLNTYQKLSFEVMMQGNADEAQIKTALLDLTTYLYQHYDEKVLVLIDEYDTPIQSGYSHGYYDQIVNLMRHLLSASLKSNPSLYRAMLTGILRVSKESLFSGLNNLAVYSILRPEYSDYFGFTEDEVMDLIKQNKLSVNIADIRDWYNGYQIGDTTIYNPWSIVNCLKRDGLLQPYWINTSDNTLIKNLLIQSSTDFKHEFEHLMQGHSIEKFIDENFVFTDLNNNETAIWSLLLMTGYLKVVFAKETLQGTLCQLLIPNQEIHNLYRHIIEKWLANGKGIQWYNEFLNHLLTGNIDAFQNSLTNIMLQTASSHDLAHKPEAFYHGLMLGLTASLDKNIYEVKSNKESGYGRYDILIIANDKNKLSIIMELKSITPPSNSKKLSDALKQAAEKALEQIENNQYIAELKQRNLDKIQKIGLAFCGKEFYLASS